MACACKSNSSNKQVSQVTKTSTISAHVVHKSTPKTARKQIVIRRPAR